MSKLNGRVNRLERSVNYSIEEEVDVRTLTDEQLKAMAGEIPKNQQRWLASLPDEALTHIVDGRPLAPIFAKYGRPKENL